MWEHNHVWTMHITCSLQCDEWHLLHTKDMHDTGEDMRDVE